MCLELKGFTYFPATLYAGQVNTRWSFENPPPPRKGQNPAFCDHRTTSNTKEQRRQIDTVLYFSCLYGGRHSTPSRDV